MYKFRILLFTVLSFFITVDSFGQSTSSQQMFYDLRQNLTRVKDYVADVQMKIDVPFMKVPTLKGKLYFKFPDKMKLERNGGIAILPKKSISLTLNNLMPSGDATVIDVGIEQWKGRPARVLKVIPETESPIILAKLWVDAEQLLILKTETTTRESGTINMELAYGKFKSLNLPDEIQFIVDVKEFKVPKGVAMDYDAGEDVSIKKKKSNGNKKGSIKINYLNYKINSGLSDKFFIE